MTEAKAAATYWKGRKLGAFSRRRDWSGRLADRIVGMEPGAVFEFGCNVGRHLVAIRERDPSIDVAGIDINEAAITEAISANRLSARVGDERLMAAIPDDAYDVAFTSSVLDHIPDPSVALAHLARISPVLVLLEPWLGYEGKVEWVRRGVRANPFLYSWDYATRLPGWSVTSEPFPLRPQGAGPYYRLHIARR